MQKTAYLSLGSNVGERRANLEAAIVKLASLGEVKAVSSFYETEPVERTDQPWFLNCVVTLETSLMPKQLLAKLLAVEKSMGRKRTRDKGPRIIDMDIVLFGSSVVDTPGLTIPHPAMHERRFVLEPLVEIAPDARHPVFKKTAREMRDALGQGQQVRRV